MVFRRASRASRARLPSSETGRTQETGQAGAPPACGEGSAHSSFPGRAGLRIGERSGCVSKWLFCHSLPEAGKDFS